MTKKLLGSLELNRIYQMDCIEGMWMMPDNSVDLIVIDPPYNIGKDKRWDKWKTVEAYVDWMTDVFKECERVLKANGSFYFWHNDFLQMVELQNAIRNQTSFQFKQMIVWDKFHGSDWNQLKAIVHSNDNRNYSKQAEYCLFYTLQDETGLERVMQDQNNFRSIKDYLQYELKKKGLKWNSAQLIDLYKSHGLKDAVRVLQHKLDDTDKQFQIITMRHYEILSELLDWERTYDSIRQEYETLRQEYEEQRYVFNNQEKPSVWQHGPMKQNGHITPKPVNLIETIIQTSSNEGDIILDCFMGSGTTAVAAARLNRNFIGFERESEYVRIANQRLESVQEEIANRRLSE